MRAFGHGAGNRFANGAVLVDQDPRDAKGPAFRFVRVSDKALDEHLGSAGNICDLVCKIAASAGLGGGELFAQAASRWTTSSSSGAPPSPATWVGSFALMMASAGASASGPPMQRTSTAPGRAQ